MGPNSPLRLRRLSRPFGFQRRAGFTHTTRASARRYYRRRRHRRGRPGRRSCLLRVRLRYPPIQEKRQLGVKSVSFVMSAICPAYPEHQTFPDPVGTSHLCHEPTFHRQSLQAQLIPFVPRLLDAPTGHHVLPVDTQTSLASGVISALRTFKTGQFFSGVAGHLVNVASSRLGRLARRVRAEWLMRKP
jgi:hypothetical protein